MTEIVSTRSSRNRRVVALMAWGCLVATAFVLWNARQTGSIRAVTAEPVAFILAAFACFVGVFAWMLYNPGLRSAMESSSLFFAATATLFPPPIIGFCLMPIDSPLRWWLAVGLFLLCAIAVLSHVPDEFFAVPRARHTYLTPIPAFDRVEGTVLDPNASWFRLEDLSKVVIDRERPSLAPRAYLQRENLRPTASTAPRAEVRTATEVDDILGTDFDLGLLDDTSLDERPPARQPAEPAARFHADGESDRKTHRDPQRRKERTAENTSARRASRGTSAYTTYNPEGQRLRLDQRTRRELARRRSTGRTSSRRVNLANTLRIEPADAVGGTSRYQAGLAGSRLASRAGQSFTKRADRRAASSRPAADSVAPRRKYTPVELREMEEEREAARQKAVREEKREAELQRAAERRREAQADEKQQQEAAARARRERQYAEDAARRDRERRETERKEAQRREREREIAEAREKVERVQRERERESERQRSQRNASSPSAERSELSAVPVPFGPTTPAAAAPSQLMGAPVERSESSTERKSRPSRYEEPAVREEARSQPSRQQKNQQPTFDRTADDDGSELVEGVMKVHFDEGQKRANIHIPFSPPLPGMPEVECEAVDGEDLRLKVPVRQSYGIRIEARRSKADKPLDAEISFAAVYTND